MHLTEGRWTDDGQTFFHG